MRKKREKIAEPTHEYSAILNAVERFASPCSVKAVVDSMGFGKIVGRDQIQWVNVALDRGYYDQSHLIRDFREFTGVSPMEYQPAVAER